MIIDLHNHTLHSFDGFTLPKELLAGCITRGINAIAITEHDNLSKIDPTPFLKIGVEIIRGCEFTTNFGAHIIGIFIEKGLPLGSSRETIINHIKEQNGLIIMPHPWKLNSGYMTIYGEDDLLDEFDFIEVINGGWQRGRTSYEAVKLARKYKIKMISSSDSHKCSQIGLCVTRFNNFNIQSTARSILETANQEDIDLLIDKCMLTKRGRRIRKVQSSRIYQLFLKILPYKMRHLLKRMQYLMSSDRDSFPPEFQTVRIESEL